MSLFPMFLKLDGRRCLVVGAGSVAEAKIESLLATEAAVRVVAPKATPKVREWARAGRIEWEAREYGLGDLLGVFLVIAATGSPALHDEIYAEARRRGVLCNAVDEPERCDFYFPAVVRRGELQIAISTGADGDAYRISIADTGTGIPEALRERILDPFFTTKPVGQGTGLGLSITYSIVRKHGGALEFGRAEGGGTEVVIRIPMPG